MMEPTQDRCGYDARSRGRPGRGQVAFAVRGLHPQAPVRSSMVVGNVPVEDVLKVALVADYHVVQAVSAEGANQTFAKSVGRWLSRWGWEQARAESPHAAAEQAAKDGVAVVDQQPGDVVSIDGRLDDPVLSGKPSREFSHKNTKMGLLKTAV